MYEKLTNSDLFRAEPENADFLIIYFEDNFGRIRRDCRSRPQFAINHWNQQERVTNDLSRTSNAAEGWHSFIRSFLQVLYYSEALPTTARILYRSFTPK